MNKINYQFKFNQPEIKLWKLENGEEKEVTNWKRGDWGSYIFRAFPDENKDYLSISVKREVIKFWARIDDRHFKWEISRSKEQPEYTTSFTESEEVIKNPQTFQWESVKYE